MSIDKDLNITKIIKNSNLSFDSYEDYVKEMRRILIAIKENAQSDNRPKKYGMISTISRGYDAVAASAFAQEIGCDKVITFNRPRKYSDDCGSDIARALGYHEILEGDGELYKSQDGRCEYENMSIGDMSPSVLSAYREEFKNNLVFLGTRGDSLWERNHGNINDYQDFHLGNTFQQCDNTNIEMCADCNSVIVHIPMIGADRWSMIRNISQSSEMKPWSIRENYDRPIVRRFVEEKGVPRNYFGQEKHGLGLSFHYDTLKSMKAKLSPEASRTVGEYIKRFSGGKMKRMIQSVRYYFAEFPMYGNFVLGKLKIPFRIRDKVRYVSHPKSTMLICLGVDKMREKYKVR